MCASGEPTNHRQHYLLLVDYYYSNFFELAQLGSNTDATCVIDAKRSQFTYHGSPELLASDNGNQFSCREFRKFTQLWDIEHATSSPRYPQSNGQAERATRSVNNIYIIKERLETLCAMESYLPISDRHAASWIFFDGPTKPIGVVKLRYNALKLFF